jgi:hypothetical protein
MESVGSSGDSGIACGDGDCVGVYEPFPSLYYDVEIQRS